MSLCYSSENFPKRSEVVTHFQANEWKKKKNWRATNLPHVAQVGHVFPRSSDLNRVPVSNCSANTFPPTDQPIERDENGLLAIEIEFICATA